MTQERFIRILIERDGRMERPEILDRPVPKYERESSRIPEQMRVSFSDGSTAVYDLRTEQPAPIIMENIRIIRRMQVGYQFKPKRRRNRT